ncbi:MAG: phosphatase PAP2 family protein [Pseudomonadota bacterium]|nr:phosphatase PAP2 family protein [Pseudomonadota bacterium]
MATANLSGPAQFMANITAGFAMLARKPRRVAGQGPRWPAPGRLFTGALATIALLAVITMLLDVWAITSVRLLPRWPVAIFSEVTDFGKSGWFLWPLGILLVAIAAIATLPLTPISRLVLAALAARLEFLFAAIALPGLFTTLVKHVIGRARPFVGGTADAYLYHPLSWQGAAYASMPSGHATTAFSVAIAFGALWPKARPVLWAYALVIALSRVVVVAHHPTDVIVGAIVGAFGAILVRNMFAARRRVFALDAQGRAKLMPGASWRRIKAIARALRGQ